jgi:hypothetical protein
LELFRQPLLRGVLVPTQSKHKLIIEQANCIYDARRSPPDAIASLVLRNSFPHAQFDALRLTIRFVVNMHTFRFPNALLFTYRVLTRYPDTVLHLLRPALISR